MTHGQQSERVLPFFREKLKAYAFFVALPVLLVALFVAQNYFFNVGIHLNPGPQYIVRFLLVNFGLGLVIYFPCIFLPRKFALAYLFLISALVGVVFSLQFLYFSYSQSFLQVSALKYAGQATSVRSTAESLATPQLLVFFLQYLFLAVVIFWRKKIPQPKLHWREVFAIFFCVLCVAFSSYYYLVHKEDQQWGNANNLYKDVYDLNTLVEKVGIVNFSIEDGIKYYSHSNLVNAQDKAFLISVAKSMPSATQGKQDFGLEKGKNIIFIQVESLETGVMNKTLGNQEITPNLNEIAKEGLYFPNYYTQVGPGNTADAEFSTLDSLYPLPDDVVFIDYPQNTYHALPQLLDNQGYGTYSLHADVPTFWNRANMYPSLGYQTQYSESDYIKSRSIGKGPSDVGDEDFLTQSLTKLQTFKQPFMATLITISSHTPFILPQDLQTLQIPQNTNLNYTQQQYLEAVHYTDKALGEFIWQLQQTPLYDNSIIFIYGDHGSFTNISNALGDASPFAGLQNSQVPLIVLAPGTNVKGVDQIPSSHIDLYPTITNLLGLPTPQGIFGQDLFNTQTPVMTHRNLFSGTVNTILTRSLAYVAGTNDIFDQGQCFTMPGKVPTVITKCQQLYTQQSNIVQASDSIVHGNLLNTFIANEPK